ncbi:nucleoside-triphosphatase [Spirochaeta isovalerica]|uniref:Nucleoside-triphosphatase THEP1 n=1 Tax=Spirochaeta isovalerica TaxID=150 RepID=A0A841RG15_9SPIO|nr:nucleoside-triphosphatase [Spirochaeta isovalerica]MBB6481488.1 nucleoside-triphosphatase THEP1 [Spirochaeta isovalerica]
MLTIITGPRGIGKTTALLAFIDRLKRDNRSPAGLITPPVFDSHGKKCGFSAMNVLSGEKWELARMDKDLRGPVFGPFFFSREGFTKALALLAGALDSETSPFILDEIGPLELNKKTGFYPILPRLDKAACRVDVFLVIRPELIEEFRTDYVRNSRCRIVEINRMNRNEPDLFNTTL